MLSAHVTEDTQKSGLISLTKWKVEMLTVQDSVCSSIMASESQASSAFPTPSLAVGGVHRHRLTMAVGPPGTISVFQEGIMEEELMAKNHTLTFSPLGFYIFIGE